MAALEDATEEEVIAELAANRAQLWPGERSAMVTMLNNTPEGRCLHIWLAGGDMHELVAMTPGLEAWGRQQGCHYANIHGRRGWERVGRNLGWYAHDGELRKRL